MALLIEAYYGGPTPAVEWLDRAIDAPSPRQANSLAEMRELRADLQERIRRFREESE